jgi:glycosyltransferase involved in cell wall biosynthesis
VAREAEVLAKSGFQVKIYAWDRDELIDRPPRELKDGYEIFRIPVKSKQQIGIRQFLKFFCFSWQAFWRIIKEDVSVIHCHDFLNLPTGVLIKLIKRIPLVYDAHEIYWIMEAKKYPQQVLKILRWAENFLLRFVDFFITVGQVRVDYYKKSYQEPIFTVGNWYDPALPDKKLDQELRSSLGIANDSFLVTYGGTLSKTRASDILLEVIDKFQHQTTIHWIICGGGILQSNFERAASQNGQLHFLGWVDNMGPILSASDALIYLMDLTHPYAKYASPNNLYTSIAWSIPLIGTEAGEIGLVLKDRESAILINSADIESISSAVSDLWRDKDLSGVIANNLKILQTKYSWDLASKRLLKVYQKI